jgi:hypothetical protein
MEGDCEKQYWSERKMGFYTTNVTDGWSKQPLVQTINFQ